MRTASSPAATAALGSRRHSQTLHFDSASADAPAASG